MTSGGKSFLYSGLKMAKKVGFFKKILTFSFSPGYYFLKI